MVERDWEGNSASHLEKGIAVADEEVLERAQEASANLAMPELYSERTDEVVAILELVKECWPGGMVIVLPRQGNCCYTPAW